MKQLFCILFILFSYFVFAGGESKEIFPIDKVEYGMKFECQSTLSPLGITKFKGVAWGVLSDSVGPGHNAIVGELQGKYFQHTKVIAGQSGSPCFVNYKGKNYFLGTISSTLLFSGSPVAYLTPAQELLDTGDYCSTANKKIANAKIGDVKKIAEVAEDISGLKLDWMQSVSVNNVFDSSMSKANYSVSSSGKVKVEPGSVLAIQFVWGDLNFNAYGTVSYIDGKKIFMLGHPIFQMGSVEFRLAPAKVLGVHPSIMLSSIIAAPIKDGKTIGVIKEDRENGVVGFLGEEPKNFISSNVKLTTSCEKSKEFKYYGVSDNILGPLANSLAVYSIVSSWSRAYGPETIFVKGAIRTDGGVIAIDEALEGEIDVGLNVFRKIFSILTQVLKNSGKVISIDLDISIFDEIKTMNIESAKIEKISNANQDLKDELKIDALVGLNKDWNPPDSCYDKKEMKSPKIITVALKLSQLDGQKTKVVKIGLKIPQDLGDGIGRINIMDAGDMRDAENRRYTETYGSNGNNEEKENKLKNMIATLSTKEKWDSIYISIEYPSKRIDEEIKGALSVKPVRKISTTIEEFEVALPDLRNFIIKGSASVRFRALNGKITVDENSAGGYGGYENYGSYL